MEGKWHNGEYSLRATVVCEAGEVQVYRDRKFGSKELSPAEVNWSALGSQYAETATEYATAILLAAQIAKEMNGEVHTYQVAFEYRDEDTGVWKKYSTTILGNNEAQVRASLYGDVRDVQVEMVK